MIDKNKSLKIRMKTTLEEPEDYRFEKESIHALCLAFHFWYSINEVKEYTLYTDVYIHTHDELLNSNFKSVIKSFALIKGYTILDSVIVDQPDSDLICLDDE